MELFLLIFCDFAAVLGLGAFTPLLALIVPFMRKGQPTECMSVALNHMLAGLESYRT